MAQFKAEIKDGNLIITAPLDPNPKPSASTGKTLIVASSHGNVPTALEVNGQSLTVAFNAYIKNPAYTK